MAAMQSWLLYQLDIKKNALLHGDLVEEVYMEQHLGLLIRGSLDWYAGYTTYYIAKSNPLKLCLANLVSWFRSLV